MSQPTEPAAPADPAEAQIVAARLAATLARWGDRLDDAGRAAVEERIRRHLDLARALRTVPLANGDEPEIVFVPFRAGEESPQ
ncbi:MAG TPA: hypothetical protein VFQ80_02120 [Thermomicrobiales bacterium]|jgi:hypothetical protein|nr:hypothetical protein [Thermomicrobiales bacterium]